MYKLNKDSFGEISCVKRLSDNAFIPLDQANVDFVEYQKWLELGNVPLPADEVTQWL